jgi:phenylpropionate dioxygenase-like ring-hydroxylating dioxygenase large terminal subunit
MKLEGVVNVVSNRWYALVDADEVPAHGAFGAKRMGRDLVFWRRASGEVVAALDRCPHRWAKLSPGRVIDGCIECPFHGFRFDGEGTCTSIPAHPDRPISGAMALNTLPVREEHGFIWLWTGPDAVPDDPVPFFDFTGFHRAGRGFTEVVRTHYTRAIENQLDFTHLPFVHRTTIGRLVREEMNVVTEVDGDRIRASDGGSDDAYVELLGPNIWRNRTGPVWQFLAFAPIDAETMQYYVRTYQPFVASPVLAGLMGWVQQPMNRWILGQDTPVVESQPAGETRLRMGEVLVPSDGPIIAYRRWREALRMPYDPTGRSTVHRVAG